MNIFLDSHKILLENLIKADVKFIIIGGFAVNYYGYSRTTGDLDLWIKPDNKNRDKLAGVLEKSGFNKKDLKIIRQTNFEQVFVFHIWEKPFQIDFLTRVSGVDFNRADKAKIIVSIQGLDLPMISFEHLILSKMTTNRLRDKADIEELQKISQGKRKGH